MKHAPLLAFMFATMISQSSLQSFSIKQAPSHAAKKKAPPSLPFMIQNQVLLKAFSSCVLEENGELAVITTFISDKSIVFDIGASIGAWSESVFAYTSPSKVYAFEPLPSSFSLLEKQLAHQPVSLHNIAISSTNGIQPFYQFTGSIGANELSSLYQRPLKIPSTSFNIPTQTLASFCTENSITHIDFLKIDTEGAELDVLKGAESMLCTNLIDYIQFEYGGTYTDAHITLKQVITLLARYNYRIFKICSQGLVHIATWQDYLEDFQYSNFLAIAPRKAGTWKCIDF